MGSILGDELNDVYRYAKWGRESLVGHMLVRKFLDEFLPHAPRHVSMPKCSGALGKGPLKPRDEMGLCTALVRCCLA